MIKQLSCGVWVVDEDTHYGKWVAEHGSLNTDPHLFAWLDPWINSPDIKVVWDLGANIGVHTRHYLDMGKQVLAFEPHPEAFQCLKLNCPEARCARLAVGRNNSIAHLGMDANVGASSIQEQGESVEMVALDKYPTEEPMHFVKLDIEGCEVDALFGMRARLERNSPLILCEVNSWALVQQGSSREELFELLRATGYQEISRYPEGIADSEPQYDVLMARQPQ